MSTKVLLFADNLIFGGVEQAVLQLLEGLDRTVWQPVLVHHPSKNLQHLTGRVDELKVRRIETPEMPLGMSGMRRMFSFLNILLRERPAVFHAHLSWPLACKWGVVASILARVPAIVVTEQLFLDIPYTNLSRLQQRLLSAGVGRYIAVSCDIADKMTDRFQITKQKLRVIHNAVEFANFDHGDLPRELSELRQVTRKPFILTVARLDEQKGHPYLLEAALKVPEAIFAFVGDGPQKVALEERVRQLKLEDRVFFFGFRNDIQNWLSVCDVFVLPSLYEGLPIAILEAMAAGKPVIATAIPGNDEAVIHGQTGYLVPPRDPGSLAAAIQSILADPVLKTSMGQAGREIVLQKFSVQAMVRQIAEVYTECLSDRYQRNG